MKKYSIALVLFALMFVLYYTANNIYHPNNNDNCEVRISSVDLLHPIELKPDINTLFSIFNEEDKLKEKIKNNMNEYVFIRIKTEIKNNSSSIEMKDVRVHPCFKNEVNDMIEIYNSGNGIYKNITPLSSTNLIQYIVLNTDMEKEELLPKVLGQEMKMVYFTGEGMINTGKGYTGIGKHTYKFVIQDATQ